MHRSAWAYIFPSLLHRATARMAKLVDAWDLKSPARKGVPVRFRVRAPYISRACVINFMQALNVSAPPFQTLHRNHPPHGVLPNEYQTQICYSSSLQIAPRSNLDRCMRTQYSDLPTMNLDEDTCEWLGLPSPLEMYPSSPAIYACAVLRRQRYRNYARAASRTPIVLPVNSGLLSFILVAI